MGTVIGGHSYSTDDNGNIFKNGNWVPLKNYKYIPESVKNQAKAKKSLTNGLRSNRKNLLNDVDDDWVIGVRPSDSTAPHTPVSGQKAKAIQPLYDVNENRQELILRSARTGDWSDYHKMESKQQPQWYSVDEQGNLEQSRGYWSMLVKSSESIIKKLKARGDTDSQYYREVISAYNERKANLAKAKPSNLKKRTNLNWWSNPFFTGSERGINDLNETISVNKNNISSLPGNQRNDFKEFFDQHKKINNIVTKQPKTQPTQPTQPKIGVEKPPTTGIIENPPNLQEDGDAIYQPPGILPGMAPATGQNDGELEKMVKYGMIGIGALAVLSFIRG